MEQLKLAQYFNNPTLSKEKKRELLKELNVSYSIPNVLPGKQKLTNWAGYTSLHFAVEIGDLDLAEELIKEGADVTKQCIEHKRTPLWIAVYTKGIFEKCGRLQEHSLINIMLTRQVKINNNLNPKCKNGLSHFHIACIVNHAEAVEFFVEAKVAINQRIKSRSWFLSGYTALHCAIAYSSVNAAEILLRHGADIYAENAEGMSCSHLLLKRLVDINDVIKMRMFADGNHCMPWEEEVERLESIVKLILKTQEKDGTFVDDTGLSALHLAAALQDKSILKDLLEKNVYDVNIPIKSDSELWPGRTPVHFAACFNIEMMILMMQNGGNIVMRNLDGETALDLCAKRVTPADIPLILSMKNEYRDITFSDNCTKLTDLLSIMNNYVKFDEFLQELEDTNMTIPFNSPVWPGYNLLHICLSLHGRMKYLQDFEEKFDLSVTPGTPFRLQSMIHEQALYYERMDLCSQYGCSVNMKNAQGHTPIHLAFNTFKKEAALKMLKFGENNVLDKNDLSYLHIACTLGDVDAVEMQLARGVDNNSRVRLSYNWPDLWSNSKIVNVHSTPVHIAVVFGHTNLVRYLLDKNADVYAKDSMGFTPIHLTMYASSVVSKSLADLFFAHNSDLQDFVSEVGLSHLHVAAWSNNEDAMDKLLRNGTEVDRVINVNVQLQAPFLADFAGNTPLLLAIIRNMDKVIEALLNGGANVYAKDINGVSALEHALCTMCDAASTSFIEIVKREKLEVNSCGTTLLHVACGDCDTEWAKQLIKDGADVNAKVRGAAPLHVLLLEACLVSLDSPELVDFATLLVDSGADPTVESSYGNTTIQMIYENNYSDVYDSDNTDRTEFFALTGDLLLNRLPFYDINPVNGEGFSHFHFACITNNVGVATKFLDHGANVNASVDPLAYSNPGFTPLHFAMGYKSREIAYLLLDRGADVNAEDTKGNTPLHVAVKKEFIDLHLMETMLSFGANICAKNMKGETLLYVLMTYTDLSVDNYFDVIGLLMGYGVDLDQTDVDGSPLNEAMNSNNVAATRALLQRGADLNVINIMEKFPIDDMMTTDDTTDEREIGFFKTLLCHVWKMRFTNITVAESNLRCLERTEEHFSLATLLEQSCRDELTKCKETEICQGLTVRDFLSELGAVAEYPRMGFIRQSIIDKFFKRIVHLRREFPEFYELLALQYRKALARIELWQPAKQAIATICQDELPDLCLEAVLRYFKNNEIKLLTEIKDDLIYLFDSC